MVTDVQVDDIAHENEQVAQRREKLQALRAQGCAFPNDFKPTTLASQIHAEYANSDTEALASAAVHVAIAGRMMTCRVMGKASFAHIQDGSAQIQVYISRDSLPEGQYSAFKRFDLGDIVAVEGKLFRTKKGELSVFADSVRCLVKALRPMPDKFHGLNDQEQRYRQRYLDLMTNTKVKQLFQRRSQLISALRRFLDERAFLEVETPMLHALAGGAAARPFTTHHNALDIPLFMRIAPELFLKRLVVGGMDRVYEINRNFRNEGVSARHNPEFTMVEFYQAYATYEDLMQMTEDLFRYLADSVLDSRQLVYQGIEIDLNQPFARMTIPEAICHYCPEIQLQQLQSLSAVRDLATKNDISFHDNDGVGKCQMLLFEKLVEKQLQQPTFITAFPTEVSPLARANEHDATITDRFELYVAGTEIANGFSELNDPEDQAARFRQQVASREAGDDEAMCYDEAYVTALEHGLPPTAGEGIGIDRLVMLFTDSASIREVILFPLMRPR